MSYFQTPFSVYVKDIILVTPSKPTPHVILPLSTVDSDYELETPAYFVRVYRGRLDRELCPAKVMREALSKALVLYFPLAGKLKRQEHRRFYVHCNALGVPFVEASANCKLSDVNYLDGVDIAYAKDLVYDFPQDDETGKHSMVMQVTTFLCGGFTIGFGASHAICDGIGGVQVLNAITELASGMSEPSVMPVWGRERLNGSFCKEPLPLPMEPADAAVSPYLPTTDLVLQSVHVDKISLRNLKTNLMKESRDLYLTPRESSFCTTYEALAAYIWRSKCKALKLNGEGETLLWIGVGIRERMHPPLPKGYYGNAFVSNYHVMKVKDLVGGPLCKVVKQVKELKKLASSDEFVRKALDYSETARQLDIHPYAYPGAVTVVVDWRQMGALPEVDFGWGRYVNWVTTAKNLVDDLDICIIAPPPSSLDFAIGDGVRVFVILPKECIAAFKQELDALQANRNSMPCKKTVIACNLLPTADSNLIKNVRHDCYF